MNYTIGQAAKLNHLTISQLRYYDNRGLLPFLKRTDKGNRIFDDEALKYLEMIICLKNTGMPIKEIKHFIDWSMMGDGTIPQRLEMMKKHEANVQQHIQETEENLKLIKQKIEKYKIEKNQKRDGFVP
jgi:DNA-binding transcriptional MerR regulator